LELSRPRATHFDHNHEGERLAARLSLEGECLRYAVVRQPEVIGLKRVNHGSGLGSEQRRYDDH
jgi:hypothetical protein